MLLVELNRTSDLPQPNDLYLESYSMNNILVVIGRATNVTAFLNALFSKPVYSCCSAIRLLWMAVDALCLLSLNFSDVRDKQQIAMCILHEGCDDIIFGSR